MRREVWWCKSEVWCKRDARIGFVVRDIDFLSCLMIHKLDIDSVEVVCKK